MAFSVFRSSISHRSQSWGIGGIEKRPVVVDDAIAIRSMMYVSMTYDHRIVDGAVADQFLALVKQTLENFDENLL